MSMWVGQSQVLRGILTYAHHGLRFAKWSRTSWIKLSKFLLNLSFPFFCLTIRNQNPVIVHGSKRLKNNGSLLKGSRCSWRHIYKGSRSGWRHRIPCVWHCHSNQPNQFTIGRHKSSFLSPFRYLYHIIYYKQDVLLFVPINVYLLLAPSHLIHCFGCIRWISWP